MPGGRSEQAPAGRASSFNQHPRRVAPASCASPTIIPDAIPPAQSNVTLTGGHIKQSIITITNNRRRVADEKKEERGNDCDRTVLSRIISLHKEKGSPLSGAPLQTDKIWRQGHIKEEEDCEGGPRATYSILGARGRHEGAGRGQTSGLKSPLGSCCSSSKNIIEFSVGPPAASQAAENDIEVKVKGVEQLGEQAVLQGTKNSPLKDSEPGGRAPPRKGERRSELSSTMPKYVANLAATQKSAVRTKITGWFLHFADDQDEQEYRLLLKQPWSVSSLPVKIFVIVVLTVPLMFPLVLTSGPIIHTAFVLNVINLIIFTPVFACNLLRSFSQRRSQRGHNSASSSPAEVEHVGGYPLSVPEAGDKATNPGNVTTRKVRGNGGGRKPRRRRWSLVSASSSLVDFFVFRFLGGEAESVLAVQTTMISGLYVIGRYLNASSCGLPASSSEISSSVRHHAEELFWWNQFSCNAGHPCGLLPYDGILLMYLCPLHIQIFFKSVNTTALTVSWLIAIVIHSCLQAMLVYHTGTTTHEEFLHPQSFWGVLIAATICAASYKIEYSRRTGFLQSKDAINISIRAEQAILSAQIESDLKIRQREEEQLRYLIGNVAHDLKTPLQSLTMDVQTIKNALLSARQQQEEFSSDHAAAAAAVRSQSFGNSIDLECVESCERLSGTISFMYMAINRAIDFTRTSSGFTLQPQVGTFNICDVLEEQRDIVARISDGVAISMDYSGMEGMNLHIMSDRHWLAENMLCLLSNAAKYTPEGGDVVVSVSTFSVPVDCSRDEKNQNDTDALLLQQLPVDKTDADGHEMMTTASPLPGNIRPRILGVSVATAPADEQITDRSRKAGGHQRKPPAESTTRSFSPIPSPINQNSPHQSSRKFMRRGGEDQDFVLIQVQDSGIGVEYHLRSSLFQPFRQSQRFAGGTGLGLYSLAERTKALGGRCGVEDRTDGLPGAVFWFTFPYKSDWFLSGYRSSRRPSHRGGAFSPSVATFSRERPRDVTLLSHSRVGLSLVNSRESSHKMMRVTSPWGSSGGRSFSSEGSKKGGRLAGDDCKRGGLSSAQADMLAHEVLEGNHRDLRRVQTVGELKLEEDMIGVPTAIGTPADGSPVATLAGRDSPYRRSVNIELLHNEPEAATTNLSTRVPSACSLFQGTPTLAALLVSTNIPEGPLNIARNAATTSHHIIDCQNKNIVPKIYGGMLSDDEEGKCVEQPTPLAIAPAPAALGAPVGVVTPTNTAAAAPVPSVAPGISLPTNSLHDKKASGSDPSASVNLLMHGENLHDSAALTPPPPATTAGDIFGDGANANEEITGSSNHPKHQLDEPRQNPLMTFVSFTMGATNIGVTDQTTVRRHSKLRILVVDDALPILKVIRRYLESEGHYVETAKNGFVALERMKKAIAEDVDESTSLDLVLMDIQMPVMDGIEAVRRFRSVETAKLSIVDNAGTSRNERVCRLRNMDIYSERRTKGRLLIVGMSANSGQDSKRLAKRAGMDFFLEKPFTSSVFMRLMDRVVMGYRSSPGSSNDRGSTS